jgi:hypothetical protein
MKAIAATALTAGLIVAGAVSSHAATLSGTYDNHCDGFSLTLYSNGDASGVETGCESGPIAGVRVGKFKVGGGAGVAVNENHVANTVYEINTTNHTWAIFTDSGTVLQSGTWSQTSAAGAQAAASNGRPATGQ